MATVNVRGVKSYKYGKPKRAKIESRYTAPFPLGSRPVNKNKEVGITYLQSTQHCHQRPNSDRWQYATTNLRAYAIECRLPDRQIQNDRLRLLRTARGLERQRRADPSRPPSDEDDDKGDWSRRRARSRPGEGRRPEP